MSEQRIYGFGNLPTNNATNKNDKFTRTRQNSSGESKSWLDWFISLFGPHATGVRNWLLIAAISLLIILSLNPVTLSATAFLSLLGIFGVIGGVALVGALTNGVRAFIAGYEEYGTQNGGRVLSPSKLGYLRHLARQFAQWVVEHPFQMAVIVLTLLAPVFAIPSLIGASTLAILYTVGNALGWAVVNDGICRLGNYIWEQCAAFARSRESSDWNSSNENSEEDKNKVTRTTLRLRNTENMTTGIPTPTSPVTQPNTFPRIDIARMQLLVGALNQLGVKCTTSSMQETVTFPCHQIEFILLCGQGINQYVIPIPYDTLNKALSKYCKQALNNNYDIHILVVQGENRTTGQNEYEEKLRSYLNDNAISVNRSLNFENFMVSDQQEIEFDLSQDAVSYKAMMPAPTNKLQI